jgi:hypothetical protein
MDLCIRVESLDELLQPSNSRGYTFTPSVLFARTRPDGIKVVWRLVGACDLAAPFYIEDVTERLLRIPDGEAQSHPNGALGIIRIEANQVPQHPVNNVQFVKDHSLAQNEFKVAIRADVTHPKVLDAQKIYGAKIIIQSPLTSQKGSHRILQPGGTSHTRQRRNVIDAVISMTLV